MNGELYTKGGVLVATGWTRVVSNDHPRHRGFYVEFHWRQATDNMSQPWWLRKSDRASNRAYNYRAKHIYYDEWQTDDGCKLLQQIRAQADFRPGYFYIKLKDLSDKSREKLNTETYTEGEKNQ